jgi:hypothetical protein
MLAGSRKFLNYAAFVGSSRQGRAYTSMLTAIADSDLLNDVLNSTVQEKKRILHWAQRSKILCAIAA